MTPNFASDNLSELESNANVCLNQLETRVSLKKMNFSPDKTKAVIYTKKRGSLADINFIYKNESITVAKCKPLLGLHLDSKLNWKSGIFRKREIFARRAMVDQARESLCYLRNLTF